jgi:hypothetical protein
MDGLQKTKTADEVRENALPLFEIACYNISSWYIYFFHTKRPSRPSLMLNDIHLNIPVPLTLPFLGTALYAQMPAAYHVPQFEIILKDEATHYFLA